jgi:carbon-monoxide dehydrogenase medium subunit
MIAAGASASIVGPKGRREVPVEQIATGPGKTSLAKGEIVASFVLPKRPPRSGDAYLRFIPRTEMDIAVVGAGVSVTIDSGGTITAARVSLGAVAPRVLLVREAATAIVGSRLEREAQDRLEAAARAVCTPIDDKRGTVEFRVQVAGVLTRRAALIALDRARTS